MIIACEGADGAGKATQTTILAEKLGATRFAFPDYSTPAGAAILAHLQEHWVASSVAYGNHHTSIFDPMAFQALQVVNRLEMLPQIQAALSKGSVVFDRFSASALVYGSLDGLDRKWLDLINASLPQPDVQIYLDISIEESFKRRPERRDRIERDRAYLELVRIEYLRLFVEKQARGREPWVVVDGVGTVAEVHERIWAVVRGGL